MEDGHGESATLSGSVDWSLGLRKCPHYIFILPPRGSKLSDDDQSPCARVSLVSPGDQVLLVSARRSQVWSLLGTNTWHRSAHAYFILSSVISNCDGCLHRPCLHYENIIGYLYPQTVLCLHSSDFRGMDIMRATDCDCCQVEDKSFRQVSNQRPGLGLSIVKVLSVLTKKHDRRKLNNGSK